MLVVDQGIEFFGCVAANLGCGNTSTVCGGNELLVWTTSNE